MKLYIYENIDVSLSSFLTANAAKLRVRIETFSSFSIFTHLPLPKILRGNGKHNSSTFETLLSLRFYYYILIKRK